MYYCYYFLITHCCSKNNISIITHFLCIHCKLYKMFIVHKHIIITIFIVYNYTIFIGPEMMKFDTQV